MDGFVRSYVAQAASDRRGLSPLIVLAACFAISLIFLFLPLTAAAAEGSLIPFEQRYRIIADDALRDSVSSRAERFVAVEPGMTVTSIARTPDGKWLKVRLDDSRVTGFIQTRRLERIAGDSRDELLAGLSARSSGASGLNLTELARSGEINQRHHQNQVERERQRRLAEQRRLEEEQRRLEAEQEALEKEFAEQRERQQQISSGDGGHSPYNVGGVDWEGVVQGVKIFTEMTNLQMEQQQRQAQQQLEQRQAMLQEADEREAAQRRRIEERQRDLQRRQQAVEEQNRIAEERQRQIGQRLAVERRQRQIARRLASSGNIRSTDGSKGGATNPVSAGARRSSSGEQGGAASSSGRSKIYEPMMETALGENMDWFSDRSLAVFYARLGAVNDISKACGDRGARVDRPTTDQLKSGDAPMRWSFGSPQCRQGGWNDAEWSCRTEMAGTCWRRD